MKVNVSDGRSVQRVSILEAGFRSMAAKAAKGDLKALQLVLNLAEQVRALESVDDPAPLGVDDLAIIDAYVTQLRETADDDGRARPGPSGGNGDDAS